jgi:Tfp pilus assembly protein PilN
MRLNNKMNFLRKHKRLILLHGSAVGLALLLLAGFFFYTHARSVAIKKELYRLEGKRKSYAPVFLEIESSRLSREHLEARTNYMLSRQVEGLYSCKWLAKIFQAFPGGKGYLTNLEQDGSTVILMGYMKDMETIADFVTGLNGDAGLSEDDLFKEVTLLSASQVKRDGFTVNTFSINLQLRYVTAKQGAGNVKKIKK